MSVITLLTDFGIKDGNVGAMKGVIWKIAPGAQIADLSHTISPQNVPEAALVLARAVPFFPENSIHVAVVDPGVGTARRPIAAQIGDQRFICPDNGLLTLLMQRAEQTGLSQAFYHLDRPEYWLPQISHVFHGRDIFAPSAAHLAAGLPLEQIGTPISDPVRLALPVPQKTARGLRGEVIHIDHFGNLSTNIRQEHLDLTQPMRVQIGNTEISGLVRTFGDRPVGELIALIGSSGNLILSVVNGSAAQHLACLVGEPVEVILV